MKFSNSLLLLALFCLLCLFDASATINTRMHRRRQTTTTSARDTEMTLTDEENKFKETVYERSKDGMKVEDEHRTIEDDAPEGGSAIVVDNHNSLDVQDNPLDKQKFEEALKAQETEQSSKQMGEQALKKTLAASRQQLSSQTGNAVVEQTTKAASEQGVKVAANDVVSKGILRDKYWRLQQNDLVTQNAKLPFNGEYTYMFWLRPVSTSSSWSQILQKGQDNLHRNPGIFFYPNSFRLHVRSGINPQPTFDNGGDAGCDPQQVLTPNQWTHVAVTHQSGAMKVYLNGQEACAAQINAPVSNTGDLYAGCPWGTVATADMADLRYLNHVIGINDVTAAFQEKRGGVS